MNGRMEKKTIIRLSLGFGFSMCICALIESAAGQTSAIKWSSFNNGFGVPKTATTAVKSIAGQSFVGRANNATTLVRSGFLSGLDLIMSVGENPGDVPLTFGLSQNYLNPFNPTTTIRYALPTTSRVSLKVYDVLGREVASLVDEEKAAGEYKVQLDANNVASGVYFYRLQAIGANKSTFIETKKLVLLR